MGTKTPEAEKKGEVYLQDGRKVRVLGKVESGFVVEPLWEQVDYDEYVPSMGHEVFVTDEVLNEPPVGDYDETCKNLRVQIDSKRATLRDLRREIATVEKDRESILSALEEVPALEHLRSFVSGEITHVVYDGWRGLKVEAVGAAIGKDPDSGYYRNLRFPVLTLQSAPVGYSSAEKKPVMGRELSWSLGGSWSHDYEEVWPFPSEKEAREFAENRLRSQFSDDPKEWRERMVESADRLRVTVPDEVREHFRLSNIEAAKKNFSEAEKGLASARREVEKLLGEEKAPA